MPLIPDVPWTAEHIGPGPGVVYVTHLHLRRLRDVPAFMRDSLAIRARASVRADPHRASMARWRLGLLDFINRAVPGTSGQPPTMAEALAQEA